MEENQYKGMNFIGRLQYFMEKKGINDNQMTVNAGLSVGLIGKAKVSGKGMSSMNIEKILLAYPELSADWLLTGAGSMLKDDLNGIQTTKESTPSELPATSDDASADTPGTAHAPEAVAVSISQKEKQTMKPIPLVTETAAAGFGNCDFAIAEQDVKDYYVIPKFRYSRVDFMIEVSGLSMHPHFNPGDIIACTILTDRKFLQWNKCHVIATREQGILVKRLMPSKQKNCLPAISDNKDYPPFDIPLDEITGIALVVGSVSLE